MSFTRYIAVLEVLAKSPAGATIGKIMKMNTFLTRGQVERTLRDLMGEGIVRVEKVPYRPRIEMKIYHINEIAAEYCGYVMTGYLECEHQRALPGMDVSNDKVVA